MKGEKGERRRNELLSIAYRLFVTKGYDKTSIDDIIAEAHIAKGTYYYYFPSKEATLEAVIDMMINEEAERARAAISMPLTPPQKIAAVIGSLRPAQEEQGIAKALEAKENIIMHEKINRRVLEEAVPLLTEVVREGISEGIFECDHIEERVRMLLIITRGMFDESGHTEGDVAVFIDTTEKTLGAKKGTMEFIRSLIGSNE